MSFIREFVRNPRQTGSIAASSAPVVRMMLDGLDLTSARSVVELGAGTGAVTDGLRRRLPDSAALLAVELNEDFAAALQRRFQGRGIQVANRSAADLPDLVREYGLGDTVDAIVSGLPWTLMSPADRRRALDAVVDVLDPDGEFVTLSCLHQTVTGSGKRLRELLGKRFGEVRREPVVWAAVPPMIAYRCAAPVKRVTVSTVANRAQG
ncbi:MAG: class I SAM-dependent methyltransferase [Micromonosporaceae bacterium]